MFALSRYCRAEISGHDVTAHRSGQCALARAEDREAGGRLKVTSYKLQVAGLEPPQPATCNLQPATSPPVPFRGWVRGLLAAALVFAFGVNHHLLAASPGLTVPPQPRTVLEGVSHTFQVTATGTAPLAFQWFRDGTALPAATNALLALAAIQTSMAGYYTVTITNAEGAITSAPVRLAVRTLNDPAYPTPHTGWNYLYAGAAMASSQTAALDGTWNHELDAWSGDGRGAGNGPPGGLSTTNGILTIEDAVTSTTGGTFNNRRFQFTHNLAQEPAVTNASTLLNDGVTLTFRARLTPGTDPFIELANAPNGFVNNSDGKGMFGMRMAGQGGTNGQLISFSLAQAIEDTSPSSTYNFAQAGLHLNQLNGNTRTNTVDPGEPGTGNVLALDPAAFHEFWITIQDNGSDPGTHRVNLWRDGALTPATFNITAGTGTDGPFTNYLALGLGSTAQRAAVDLDFFGYRAGVVEPTAFNQPIGILTPPASQYVAAGQPATFQIALTGTPPYTIQWQRDGTPVSGATNLTYTLAAATAADAAATFTAIVANEFLMVTSSPPAELHLLGPPMITTQPASLTVTNGDPALLAVLASSSVNPSYQWRFNGTNLLSSQLPTLNFSLATPANAGSYDVIITNPSGSATSQLATLTVITFDYGDAPDAGYQTLRASDGARHRVRSGIHLGATVDVDLDGSASPLANGDDTAATDDEDGVNFLTAWIVGQTATVQVIASTNGLLNAWVDWNHDANWNTPGDQIYTNLTVLSGTNTLTLQIPPGALAGNGYARFRFATTGNLSPAGPAADGEVEDYLINVTPRADISVTFASSANGTNAVAVQSDVTFTLQLANNGPSTATSIALTNLIPAGAQFIAVSTSQGACFQTGDQVLCDLGAMNHSATVLIQITLRPTTAGTFTLTSHVSSATADSVSLNDTATATVTALEPPTITEPPLSQTVTNGSPVTLTATAAGAAPLRYQWHFGGLPLAGQTNSTLNLPNVQPAHEGTYTVRVTNQVGTVSSVGAQLLVLTPPAFTGQPTSLTNLAGSTATFTATATGTEPLDYQWRYNGTPIPTAQLSTLTLPDVRLTNAGNYSLTLSNAAGMLTSAVATLTVIEMDFGDASAGYPTTLAANGARHRLAPGIRLGATVDFEPVAQPDALAAGDDLNGADDEDGVQFNTPLRTGQTVSLAVVASTNGFLNAWVDFNRNTNWSDVGEQIFLNRSLVAGTNQLSFNVPAGASIGSSVARFRFATTSGLTFVGEAANGEVEDHPVTIEAAADLSIVNVSQRNPVAVGSQQLYTIVVSNAGPVTATGVSLGDILPVGTGFVSALASQGGCTHSAGLVICALGTLSAGGTATVTITATAGLEGTMNNTTTVEASQIDLNPDNNTVMSLAVALIIPSIVGQPASQTVTNGGAATFSVAANGTSLRYQWQRNGTTLLGATRASFTLPIAQPKDEGAYSVRITNEVGVALSATASLTVLLPVTITAQPQGQTVLAGSTFTFSVAVTGTDPFSYQWEYNGSDVMGQTGASLVLNNVQTNQTGAYQVRVSNQSGSVLSSVASLTVLLPPTFTLQPVGQTNPTGSTVTFTTAVIGSEPLRMQWFFNQTNMLATQTNSSLTLTALLLVRSGNYTLVASNSAGVSTSAVAVLAVFDLDFGDAPPANGYPTTLAFNGARHRVMPGIRLGASIDAETNGPENTPATGDDLAGIDDEDGVAFPRLLLGQTVSLTVIASTNGFLDAWLDFNGNGTWNDPGEQVLNSRAVSAGTNQVPVTIATTAIVGNRFARFRFSTGGGLSFDGYAPDGEVEDYQVPLSPAVDLQLGLVASANPITILSNLIYTISVTNRGPSRAGLVWVTNALPPSFTFLSAATSGGQGFCDSAGSIVYCLLDDLAADAVASIELTVRANATGSFTNRAWVFALSGGEEASPGDNSMEASTMVLGAPVRYSNVSPIAVADAGGPGSPGKGSPYPSTIEVSGLTSALYRVTVAVSNLTHDFAKDFDVLLVGPRGQTTLLMSDAGATAISGVSLVFDDAADPLPSSGVIRSGSYRPSNYGVAVDVFPAPAPAGPYGSSLSQFNRTDPNGLWSLYVVDGIVGGLGAVQGGWQLEISTVDPFVDVAVTAAAPPGVALGSNLVYAVTVTNRGPAVASAVRLTNAWPAGASFVSVSSSAGNCSQQAGIVVCDFGTLQVGGGATVALTVWPNTVGFLTNVFRASAAQLDLVPTNQQVHVVTRVRLATDLVVAQVPSTNLVLLGPTLTYSLQVTNRGPNAATAVRLTDTFPLTANFVSALASQGSCSNAGGVVVCQLGSLAVGGRAQVLVSVVPTLIGSLLNEVSVSSDEIDSLASNNVSVLMQSATVAADLALSVADGVGQVLLGDVVTYSIVVTNRGPSSAPGATLTNVLPAGFSFVSASSSIGSCEVVDGAVLCAMVSLDAESRAEIFIRVRPLAPGLVTNSFSVGAASVDFVLSNNSVSVPLDVRQPPFIVSQPLNRTVTNGGAVSFSITATGSVPMSYQWKHRGVVLPGATNAGLSLPVVVASSAGAYSVVVTNAVGSAVSDVAVLRVLVSPVLGTISRNGTVVKVSFGTVAGLSYTLEHRDAPAAGNWKALGTVSGTGGTVLLQDAGAAGANRIYRVRVE